jgi:ADP-heptose:LPS heptosyltransferase
MKISFKRIRRILIINLGGIGDMIFSIPFLRGLKQNFKNAKIVLLAVSGSSEIINNLGYLDEIRILDVRTEDIRILSFKIFKYIKFFWSLRKEKYDMVINLRSQVSLYSAIKMAIIFSITHAKYKVGRDYEKLGFFYNIKIPERKVFQKHEIEYHKELAKKLGFEVNDDISIKLEKEYLGFADNFFKINGIKEDDTKIIINIEARWQTRRWQLENYISLIEKMLKEIRCKILIIIHKDIEAMRKIKERFKNIVFLQDGNIKNIAGVISKTNLLITNDTGIMHIGTALNIPIVALFGSSDPYLTGPYISKDKYIILYKKVDCSPCNKTNCDSMKCFKNITVEDVFNAVKKLLKI